MWDGPPLYLQMKMLFGIDEAAILHTGIVKFMSQQILDSHTFINGYHILVRLIW